MAANGAGPLGPAPLLLDLGRDCWRSCQPLSCSRAASSSGRAGDF